MTNRLKTFILGALILFYIFIMLSTTVVEGYEVLNPSMYNTQMNSSCDSENWPLGSLGVLTRVTNDIPRRDIPSTSNINVYIHSLESPLPTPFVSTPALVAPPAVTVPAVTVPAITTPFVNRLVVNPPAVTTPVVRPMQPNIPGITPAARR